MIAKVTQMVSLGALMPYGRLPTWRSMDSTSTKNVKKERRQWLDFLALLRFLPMGLARIALTGIGHHRLHGIWKLLPLTRAEAPDMYGESGDMG